MHQYSTTLDEEKSLLQWLVDVREGPGYLGILDLRGWKQKYFGNIEELLPLIKQYRENANLYISMASFQSPNLNRSKENAMNLRSFWLDLDSHGDGKYKYPEGKAAYDRCAATISGTDGEYAYCSMLFHYAEQSASERKQMCHSSVKNKYYDLASSYSYQMYLRVWKCK